MLIVRHRAGSSVKESGWCGRVHAAIGSVSEAAGAAGGAFRVAGQRLRRGQSERRLGLSHAGQAVGRVRVVRCGARVGAVAFIYVAR